MAMVKMVDRDYAVPGRHHKEIVASGLTGDTVVITPTKKERIVCTLIPETLASGYFEFTTSSDADVVAGTATWQKWASGTVSTTTTDAVIGTVTGLRIVSVSGSVTGEILL